MIIAPKVAFNTTEPLSSIPWGIKSLNDAINKTPAANGVPNLIKYPAQEAFWTKIIATNNESAPVEILATIT